MLEVTGEKAEILHQWNRWRTSPFSDLDLRLNFARVKLWSHFQQQEVQRIQRDILLESVLHHDEGQ